MFSKALIILCMLSVSYAATWLAHLPPIPAKFGNKQGCYIKEIDDVVPFGKVVKPIGHCVRITCGLDVIQFASCGTVGAGEGCYVTKEDLTKPYPSCCPTIKCIKDNQVV